MDDLELRVSALEADLYIIKYNMEQLKSWIEAQARLRDKSANDAAKIDQDYRKATVND